MHFFISQFQIRFRDEENLLFKFFVLQNITENARVEIFENPSLQFFSPQI